MMWMKAKGKKRKRLTGITLIYDALYIVLFAGFYFMIFAINGFEKGVNHYSSQIRNLFPITSATVFWGMIGCLVYLCYLIFNTGIFTMGSLTVIYKKERKPFYLWVIGSLLFMIVEIVFMIVLTGEGVGVFPHKILFRYFQIWMPVLLIVFIKKCGSMMMPVIDSSSGPVSPSLQDLWYTIYSVVRLQGRPLWTDTCI